MTDSNRRPSSRPSRSGNPPRPSTGPVGTPRVGRRETDRRRRTQQSALERFRTPLVALAAVAVVGAVSVFVFASASAPVYACTTVDTVQPAASGELGQVQADMGNAHVQTGDQVTYPVCPPASGKHVNRSGFGPLQPKVYGPDDQSSPNGWVHNLEHGALVLLYSCEKGGCDEASLALLRDFSSGFPDSPVCALSPGVVGPVVARFEPMPTRFAALLWDRVLYLDTLDKPLIYDFFTRYAERVSDDGTWIAPPEEQCVAPSPSASAAPSASAEPSPSASAAPSPAAPAPTAEPDTQPSPSAG